MKKGSGKKPQCHPTRKHYAKGLCASCYHAQMKKEKRSKHKQPVVVTHTHEVIRQVQQEKQTMAANEKENDKPKPSVAGYSGSAHEGKKIERPADAPKDAVVSDAGVTPAGGELGGDGVTPKAEWDEKYKEIKKKQDELDEKRRQRAVEDSGNVQTTEKHKHG